MSKIRPLGGHVVVELDEIPEEAKKVGLILLPGTVAQEHYKHRCGTVVAVGPGYTDDKTKEVSKPQWEPGMHVMLCKHGGFRAEPNDPKCRTYIVNDTDILGEV